MSKTGRETPHEHLWVDFDFPRDDGSVTQWCPRCGEKREKAPPASPATTDVL